MIEQKTIKQESIAIENQPALGLKTTSERLPFAGTVVIMVAACVTGISLFLFWNHPLSPFVQAFVFFLAGLLHVFTLQKGLHTISTTGEWIFTLAAGGLIFLILSSTSLWEAGFPFYLSLSCACAFLLPFALTEMWRAHLQLALDGAKIWYPTKEAMTNYPTFYFNSTPMRFRVLQGAGQPNVTIKFKVSNEMPLGKIFYDLVQHKSKKTGKDVALADAERNLYRWVFFTGDGLVLTRPLDPEKTLYENGLQEKNVIYVQRLAHGNIGNLNEQQNEFD